MAEEKVRVPFPSAEARLSDLVGILRRQNSSSQGSSSSSSKTSPKPIALILHGVLAHKDQLYHRRLAELLPLDSFRFDFRANGESPGEWGMGDLEKDVEDLQVVIKYLRKEYNYHVEIIIGHSRGSLVGWTYFSDIEKMKRGEIKNEKDYILDPIPYWASLAGRWRMERIHDRDSIYDPAIAEKGYYSWNVKVAGQKVSVEVRRKDIDKFANYPIEEKVNDFPKETDCVVVQGVEDKTVPPADAGFYLNKLNRMQRRPGSTLAHFVDDADHNFRGRFDHVVDYLCNWFQERRQDGTAEAAKDLQARLDTKKPRKSKL